VIPVRLREAVPKACCWDCLYLETGTDETKKIISGLCIKYNYSIADRKNNEGNVVSILENLVCDSYEGK
jgi:hypothetical protein